MTRINLVDPFELTDQHLFAEFREIKMVPMSLGRSLNAYSFEQLEQRIPRTFKLGTGHVMFFYNKLLYLQSRFYELCDELDKRHVAYNRASVFDQFGVLDKVYQYQESYAPTTEDFKVIRARIAEKIAMKPSWYKYYSQPLDVLPPAHPCVDYYNFSHA